MLDGKVALITGAAGRIGSVLSRSIINSNAQAVLVDISQEKLSEVTSQIQDSRCLLIVADTSLPNEIDRCLRIAVKKMLERSMRPFIVLTHNPRDGAQGLKTSKEKI